MTSRTKYSEVTAERKVMYFSVTSENCRTSPVFSSAFGRTDFTNPPNSAPKTSSGTCSFLIDSIAMPSRPMRLTASVPSTRSLMPASTSLNTAHLAPRDFREPRFELDDLRMASRRLVRRFIQCRELRTHGLVIGIAQQDRLVDLAGVGDEALSGVEIGHGERRGDVFARLLFGGRENVRRRLDHRDLRGHVERYLGVQRRAADVHPCGRLDLQRRRRKC